MSGPRGDQPSPPSPSQPRQYFRAITAVPLSDPACAIWKQTRWQERCARGRLVCVDDMSEADPWRCLLNNSGDGESS